MRRTGIKTAAVLAAVATVTSLSTITTATAAPVDAAASHPSHAFGLDLDGLAAYQASHPSAKTTVGNPQAVHAVTTAPASYSLKQYAQSPGDQGQVGSCVAWATGYTGIGLLMNEQGITGDPMAPMFIYAQIAKGNDQGTWASVALPMERDQGIDTKADYWQGDFDYTTQPDAAERTNAAHYKISGYTDLTNSADRVTAIKNAIASGLPVPIGFHVKSSFYNLTATNDIYVPKGQYVGGHEVTIVGYDANYVTIENSWGKNWGNQGFFRMSWSTITSRDVNEVHSIGKLL
jgi:C1A family cysteine protease